MEKAEDITATDTITSLLEDEHKQNNVVLISENWSEYNRMLHNIKWKAIPNSFIEIDPKTVFFNIILAIMKQTNNTPSKIRNKTQFIDILKNEPDETTQYSTFYDAHKQFIDDNFVETEKKENGNSLSISVVDDQKRDKSDNTDDEYSESTHYEESKTSDAYKHSNNNIQSLLYKNQVKQQKLWVIINAIFILFVTGLSLPLLYSKAHILKDFYNDSQCCYCLWVGQEAKLKSIYKIEWSHCAKQYGYFNQDEYSMHKVCHIDDEYYCGAKSLENEGIVESWSSWDSEEDIFDIRTFSTTSTFFARFPKYYPYYGYLNISIAIVYVIYLIISTFYHELLLSVHLFIGNIVLSADTFYTYIKLYQYSKYNYGVPCESPEPPNYTQICYKNAIKDWMEGILHVWVWFVMFCICYPFVFTIGSKFCSKIKCCRDNGNKFERWLRNITLVIGVIFVLLASWILIQIIIVRDTEFNIMGIGSKAEETILVLITVSVFIFAFDVFLLQHCRQRTRLMYKNCVGKHALSVHVHEEIYTAIHDT